MPTSTKDRVRDTKVDNSYGEGPTKPADGTWHYVVGVVDRNDAVAQMFVDGVPYDTQRAGSPWQATEAFVLGGVDAAAGEGFTGAIDEVRAYDRALTPAEVWQLYAAESGQGPARGPSPGAARSGEETSPDGTGSPWLVAGALVLAVMAVGGAGLLWRRRTVD